MIFVMQTEEAEVVRSFVARSSARLGFGFSGFVRVIQRGPYSCWVVVSLDPLFPPVWRYLALGIAGAIWIGGGFSYWMLLALVPLLVEVFLTVKFQSWLFKRGLKKAGYAGPVSDVPLSDLVGGLTSG